MQVKIKYLHPDAKTPTYATEGAACFDLYAANWDHETRSFGTGLAFDIPKGWVMKIYSRSGDGFKRGLTLCNSVGIIDSDFRGEVRVKFNTPWVFSHEIGDRIAQASLEPVSQVTFDVTDEITETKRGQSGFGSTGVK